MKQKHNYHSRVYSATCNGTTTQIKAYLRSNAVIRLQQLDRSITDSDVYATNARNSHQVCVDEIIEECDRSGHVSYRVEMKKD